MIVISDRGLYRARTVIDQTNLLVLSDRADSIHTAIRSIRRHRKLLEKYVHRNPFFLRALSPVRVEDRAPKVVRLAAKAAEIANVGPMAAIPGALGDLAIKTMARKGGSVNVIENGGEISGFSIRPINIGIYAGASPLSGRIGFRLERSDFPLGMATSSATVGHATSFGRADAAVVLADSASLADAAATSICNAVKDDDVEKSIRQGLRVAKSLPVRSTLIIRGGRVGVNGRLPKLLKLDGKMGDLLNASLHAQDMAFMRSVQHASLMWDR